MKQNPLNTMPNNVAEYEKSTTPRQNFFPQRGIL